MSDDAQHATVEPRYSSPDGEELTLHRCVCGVEYKPWDMILGVELDHAEPMPCCGRRLYWSQLITIHDADQPKG